MRVAVGADHAGFPLKAPLVEALTRDGHEVLDLGTSSSAPVDYPDYAAAVGAAVQEGRAEAGILVCGSGAGVSIAANKVRGVRAALCGDAETARGARAWNDANVLCLSLRSTSPVIAREILDAWFAAEPDPSEAENVRRIKDLDR